MLIESVVIRAYAADIVYDVVAITGPEQGNWTDYFQVLAGMKQEVMINLMLALSRY